MTEAEIELGAHIAAIEDWCLTHTGLCLVVYPPFYLPRILLTQPWLTRSCLEMSQGRTPWWASSTIRCLTTSGRGLPFTNTPPSWFTPPCPTWDTTATPQTDVTLHKVVIDRKVQAGKYLKKIISGRKKITEQRRV